MDDATIRQRILDHYAAAGIDERRVAEIYADDVILDFPQGRERLRGKENIVASRSAYPAQVRIHPRRIVGSGDIWVIEGTITYDGVPRYVASIWEFRDGKVVHETSYVTEGWEPPAWRSQWVEPIADDPDSEEGRA